jgi:FkbM family methyltransferase
MMVLRSLYGKTYWKLWPDRPIEYKTESSGVLLLEPGHSFTVCFWPAVDRYESDVQAALFHFLREGSVFVDCGANVGYFSVLAHGIVGPSGRVIAIEANPVTFRLLQRNLQRNGMKEAINCALATSSGEITLYMPATGDVYSSLRTGGLVVGDNIQSFKVAGMTLDEIVASLGLRSVDLIKIDIEGGELDVLRSAAEVVAKCRPVIICEYGTNTWPAFGASKSDLESLMRQYGYFIGRFDVETGRVRAAEPEVFSSPYTNLVLLPEGSSAFREATGQRPE